MNNESEIVYGRIIANFRATVAIQLDDQSAIEQAYPLRNLPLLVTGDRVSCIRDEGVLRVQTLEPRSSVLERADRRGVKPLAANLTHLGIVSAAPPGIDTLLIDQFCLAAYQSGISAMIIFNKADKMDASERQEAQALLETYRQIGYPAVMIDTKTDNGMEPLLAQLPGRSFNLVGASGVGKSSIIQRLLPDRQLRVGAISQATGFGSHTTSVTFWYELPEQGAIIDSPGVRQYSVSHLSEKTVREGYLELARAAGHCRFGNCSHTVEPGCAVLDSLADGQIARWRYDNYTKLASESLKQAR